MQRSRRWLVAVWLLVAGSAQAAGRPISLAEALDLALRQNLELEATEREAAGAHARALGTLAQVGPTLHVDANVYEWNSPFSIAIGGMPFLVRQDFTSIVTVSGTQPLLGLWPRIERYRGRNGEQEAARADVQTARAEVRWRVTAAYLQLLEAIDVEQIATRAVADADEQLARARSLAANGRLLDADLLRIDVARARTRQDLLAASAAHLQATAMLAAVIGLPVDVDLEPQHLDLTRLPELRTDLPRALAESDRQRTEIGAARARADAARAGQAAALGDMLPSLDFTGGYQHTEGQSFFPRDAAYVAGVLSWDFWSWGAKYEQLRAEQARADVAAIQVERARRDVSLEATQRFVEARTARAAVDVARAAVGQAEEAYRVLRVSYENGRATTTDIIDAELAQERARMASVQAVYRFLLAHAALERATGTTTRR